MTNMIRYGIIGAGAIARMVSWVFQEDANMTAVAIADVDRHAAEELARTLGIQSVYESYQNLLDRNDIDAVYVATPPFLHLPMTLDAIAAGKHVICEKPYMMSLSQVREVEKAARAKPALKLGCCSSRFSQTSIANQARKMAREGELGTVYRLWLESNSSGIPPQEMSASGVGGDTWKSDPARSGGGIDYDWGVYDLDFVDQVLPEHATPLSLYATVDQSSSAPRNRVHSISVELSCEGGLHVHWARRSGEHGPARHRAEIRGTKGGLDLAMLPGYDEPPLIQHLYSGKSLSSQVRPEAFPPFRDLLVQPIRELTSAILEDRTPVSSLRRQIFIHAVLDAARGSAQLGTAVPISLSSEVK